MAEKEATVFIVDVGRPMGEKHHGRSTSDLEWSMQYVWDKITTAVGFADSQPSFVEHFVFFSVICYDKLAFPDTLFSTGSYRPQNLIYGRYRASIRW